MQRLRIIQGGVQFNAELSGLGCFMAYEKVIRKKSGMQDMIFMFITMNRRKKTVNPLCTQLFAFLYHVCFFRVALSNPGIVLSPRLEKVGMSGKKHHIYRDF